MSPDDTVELGSRRVAADVIDDAADDVLPDLRRHAGRRSAANQTSARRTRTPAGTAPARRYRSCLGTRGVAVNTRQFVVRSANGH